MVDLCRPLGVIAKRFLYTLTFMEGKINKMDAIQDPDSVYVMFVLRCTLLLSFQFCVLVV